MADVFSNGKLLMHIRDAKHNNLALQCHRCHLAKKGDLKGNVMVWYHPTNILLLYNAQRKR